MILKATIPNYERQPSDEITLTGSRVTIKRNGAVIYSALLDPLSEPISVFEFGNQAAINTVLWEKRMPGINLSMTNVSRNTSTGVVTVSFSSGNSRELSSWSDAAEIADAIDAAETLGENVLIGRAYRASPDGTNLETQVGGQVSLNLLADQPIVYTEPS